jgi:hypothetical protein
MFKAKEINFIEQNNLLVSMQYCPALVTRHFVVRGCPMLVLPLFYAEGMHVTDLEKRAMHY